MSPNVEGEKETGGGAACWCLAPTSSAACQVGPLCPALPSCQVGDIYLGVHFWPETC